MNQSQINEAINNALDNLNETNEMLYDYWMEQLFFVVDSESIDYVKSAWNEENLALMEKDVMNQILAVENFQN